jgi:hypothetical protein
MGEFDPSPERAAAMANLGFDLSERNVRFLGVCAVVRKSRAKLSTLFVRERPREGLAGNAV